MGRQIVYCEGCGHSLREDDFEKGRARMIDNRPFCTECRPFEPGEEQPQQGRRSSSGKVAAQQRKNATGSIPVIAPPRRPAAAQNNSTMVIAIVGAILLLILIFVFMQGGSRKPALGETMPVAPQPPVVAHRPEPAPVSAPSPPPPPPPPPPTPVVRTPPPPAAPTGPLVAPSASEKLDNFIAQIRGMIQGDARFERIDEILNMFTAASKSAGPRSAEIAKMRSEYIATLPEAARASASWSEWRITSSADAQQTQMMASHNGRNNVQMTHPVDRGTPAKLERDVDVPAGRKTSFSFWVSNHQSGDFELRVFIDGKQTVKEMIGPPGAGWRQKTIDLTPYAGKRIALRVENFPNDWSWEHAYWSDFAITSE